MFAGIELQVKPSEQDLKFLKKHISAKDRDKVLSFKTLMTVAELTKALTQWLNEKTSNPIALLLILAQLALESPGHIFLKICRDNKNPCASAWLALWLQTTEETLRFTPKSYDSEQVSYLELAFASYCLSESQRHNIQPIDSYHWLKLGVIAGDFQCVVRLNEIYRRTINSIKPNKPEDYNRIREYFELMLDNCQPCQDRFGPAALMLQAEVYVGMAEWLQSTKIYDNKIIGQCVQEALSCCEDAKSEQFKWTKGIYNAGFADQEAYQRRFSHLSRELIQDKFPTHFQPAAVALTK